MQKGMPNDTLKDQPFKRMDSNYGKQQGAHNNNNNLPDDPNTTSEMQPLLRRSSSNMMDITDDYYAPPWNSDLVADADYCEIVQQAEKAIEAGILPVRIAAGSSGSYFIRNLEGKTVGVFKPRDEEPYGRNNPKWTKWVQKTLCPCCFGRGCLIPNQGYLSEAGASIIDRKLRLNIVPKTAVIRLAADSFNYPAYQRHLITAKREINQSVGPYMQGKRVFQPHGLRPKTGSLQLFVENYIDAEIFLKQLDHISLSEEAQDKFQKQFEKLVVLDYIIRNTDRNHTNWLVKYEAKANKKRDNVLHFLASPKLQPGEQADHANADDDANAEDESDLKDDVLIAAIDNGLAFPYKHPDEWRAYPFHWAWLRQAKVPFSDEIKSQVLPFLSDMHFVQHELCDEIEQLFYQDKHCDPRLVERQLCVMRGQILNLAQAMRDGKSPFQLVQMPSVIVERIRANVGPGQKQFNQKLNQRYPLFSWF